jgi:hypothetical protein
MEVETTDNSFVNDVKLQKHDKDLYGLNRNGHALRCPRLVPSSICNSACPLFLMRTKSDGGYVVSIGCGNSHTEHEVKEIMPYISKK